MVGVGLFPLIFGISPTAPDAFIAAKFAVANAVVASLVELSPALCVVAVVPLGSAGVPLRFAAVPVVFWFRVGRSAATIARKLGAPALPPGAAKKEFAV
jgi:hypothetical protein